VNKKWIISLIGGIFIVLVAGLVFVGIEDWGVPSSWSTWDHMKFILGIKKSNPKYIPDEIIVAFKEGVSEDRIMEINNKLKVHVVNVFDLLDAYVLKIPDSSTVPEMIEKYQLLPEVKYAEPNYIGELAN